eukprot:Awhi_evm1s8146
MTSKTSILVILPPDNINKSNNDNLQKCFFSQLVIGGDGYNNDLFGNWPYLDSNPTVGKGLHALSYNCKEGNPEYASLRQRLIETTGDNQVNVFHCLSYDSMLVTFTGLSKMSILNV